MASAVAGARRGLGLGNSPFLTSPHSIAASLSPLRHSTAPFGQTSRSFFNGSGSIIRALQHKFRSSISPYDATLQLKSLERKANLAVSDAALQYQFLYELAQVDAQALVTRVTHPSFRHYALSSESAVLFLLTLQREFSSSSSQKHEMLRYVDVDDLLRRIQQASPYEATRVQQWKQEMTEQKLNKDAQVQYLLSSMAAPAAFVGGAMFQPHQSLASHLPSRGAHPKSPLHVQIIPSSQLRTTIVKTLGSVLMLLVTVSALQTVLDEKMAGGGIMGGSKHIQEVDNQGKKIKFDDVKGVDEAKAELEEIVLYLKDPGRFTRLGGKLPRGLLLTGPPGTGKTLLAKAIAGEADVPFFFASGSQFEEVFVGLGAKRVRELFVAAKKKAPCIIFIDELDSVGGTRKLKDQSALKMTLNELLVQLDGFEKNEGVIVIGATNFKETLDAALLRPGRFDKHVVVPLPDVGGRKEILELYVKDTKLAKDVDLRILARGTTGFSGADLYNLVNQAALKASIDGLNCITMAVFEYAKDKIIMGAERKTAVISAETARCTAYHEAGHALVAVMTEGAMPIHKATIMPRGGTLGMVTMLPEGDQTSQSHKQMLAFMDVAMGGRVAEELVFGKDEVTSGAMSDIQGATRVARYMVTKLGFSDKVGIVSYGGKDGEDDASSETRARIDQEIRRLTDEAYKRAKDLLMKHAQEHKLLAETLLEYETLTGDEVRDLVKKRIKPNRPVINTKGGARGDTSIVNKKHGGKKSDEGPVGRLLGK
jgi:ATP-dependent metalloprotease